MADSSRHRSSTLKPIRQPPARLHLPPHSESTQFRPTSPAHKPFSAGPTPRPASPTPTHTNPHVGGIRAHLAHLLPRHAVFTVTLTLHQLHNVPLVHGEFGLRWMIKGVTSHSGNSLLDKVKARKAQGKLGERSRPGTIAELPTKGSDTDNASLFDAASVSDTHSIANSSSTHSHSNDHINGSAHGHTTHAQPIPIPAVVVYVNHPSPSSVARSVSGTSSIPSVSSASSMSLASPHLNGRFNNPPGYLSADWSRQGQAQSSMSAHDTGTPFVPPNGDTTHCPQTLAKFHYSPAKGITPFVKLKEHSVVWEKTLKFMVQMSVGRDNGELGDCLARFVVMQRVIAGDPDAPRNPRLGVVYLNLAQYVDAGVITRRYLLRESKTNATLKLSVHVEHTAGELAYVAPPLPKGEILSGVAGFLESSDIYRTRPRASDLYTHTSSDSSSEDVVAASGSDTSSIVSGSGMSHGGPSSHGHADGHGRQATVKKQRRPFEIAKLPTINDPRGTEKLIEALFNPAPVTQLSKVTPFTYLVEVDGEGDVDRDGDGEHSSCGADRAATTHEDQGARPGMVALADGEGDDSSLYADSQDESADEADGLGSDYHSLRSHPSFQGSLRSKQSIRSLASKVGLKHDDVVEDTAVSTGIHLLGGVTERRTWWQKVLSPPAAG